MKTYEGFAPAPPGTVKTHLKNIDASRGQRKVLSKMTRIALVLFLFFLQAPLLDASRNTANDKRIQMPPDYKQIATQTPHITSPRQSRTPTLGRELQQRDIRHPPAYTGISANPRVARQISKTLKVFTSGLP